MVATRVCPVASMGSTTSTGGPRGRRADGWRRSPPRVSSSRFIPSGSRPPRWAADASYPPHPQARRAGRHDDWPRSITAALRQRQGRGLHLLGARTSRWPRRRVRVTSSSTSAGGRPPTASSRRAGRRACDRCRGVVGNVGGAWGRRQPTPQPVHTAQRRAGGVCAHCVTTHATSVIGRRLALGFPGRAGCPRRRPGSGST